jgi:hypothetical protein
MADWYFSGFMLGFEAIVEVKRVRAEPYFFDRARRRPPEILVQGNERRIVRRRETFEDLVAAER